MNQYLIKKIIAAISDIRCKLNELEIMLGGVKVVCDMCGRETQVDFVILWEGEFLCFDCIEFGV